MMKIRCLGAYESTERCKIRAILEISYISQRETPEDRSWIRKATSRQIQPFTSKLNFSPQLRKLQHHKQTTLTGKQSNRRKSSMFNKLKSGVRNLLTISTNYTQKKGKPSLSIDERAKTQKPFLAQFEKLTKEILNKSTEKRDYLKGEWGGEREITAYWHVAHQLLWPWEILGN